MKDITIEEIMNSKFIQIIEDIEYHLKAIKQMHKTSKAEETKEETKSKLENILKEVKSVF